MKLNRKNKLLIGLCTAALILIAKLFSIQIVEDKYKFAAENNSLAYTTIYPKFSIFSVIPSISIQLSLYIICISFFFIDIFLRFLRYLLAL